MTILLAVLVLVVGMVPSAIVGLTILLAAMPLAGLVGVLNRHGGTSWPARIGQQVGAVGALGVAAVIAVLWSWSLVHWIRAHDPFWPVWIAGFLLAGAPGYNGNMALHGRLPNQAETVTVGAALSAAWIVGHVAFIALAFVR